MRASLFLVLSVLVGMVVHAEAEDAQLRHILERAVRYEDNPHAAWAEVRYAIRVAGGNSNRVVSLMKQLIGEETERDGIAGFYISEIGKYGTIADLPFLYSKVAMTNLSGMATEAVLKIDGLTTNTLSQIITFLPSGTDDAWASMRPWCRILEVAERYPTNTNVRAMAVSNAVSYASRLTSYVNVFDDCITHADPTYHTSKRRLAVMRSVRDLGVNEWQTNFVTQAIRELEAYPEANLPE